MKFFVKSLVPILFLLAVGSFAFGQRARPNFNRPQTFDAQNYTIRASFDRAKKLVYGDMTISLKPLKPNFRVVELDAVDMRFDSVKLETAGIDLAYRLDHGKIIITLDRDYASKETISIRLKYTAAPKKGVYFVDAETEDGRVAHSAQIWSQGEADEARHWFPSFDFPSDKATTEEYITAEKGETVVGNGEFLGKTDTADGKVVWHYKMLVPHSTYLVSFVIGDYVRLDDKYRDIPLGFYVYPGKEATARKAFSGTADMIGTYEKLTGITFPYNKYDQTIVAKFRFGGMENITATTMADSEIFFSDFDFGADLTTDLVSHELAHSWFGDLVTCKNWAELWLNEGFATYMEAAYREQKFGRADYLKKVQSDADEFLADDAVTGRRHGLYNLRAGDVDELFEVSSVTYNKGGVVLYMLREQIGTEAFWKAVNIYLNRHKFANVESTDLKTAMEEASGQNLSWFFDQWVYHSGAPKLDIKSVYSARTRTLRITVTQTQTADTLVPAAFRLPMNFEISSASGKKTEKLDVTRRTQIFTFKLESKPTAVEFDTEYKIPLKVLKLQPLLTLS